MFSLIKRKVLSRAIIFDMECLQAISYHVHAPLSVKLNTFTFNKPPKVGKHSLLSNYIHIV